VHVGGTWRVPRDLTSTTIDERRERLYTVRQKLRRSSTTHSKTRQESLSDFESMLPYGLNLLNYLKHDLTVYLFNMTT